MAHQHSRHPLIEPGERILLITAYRNHKNNPANVAMCIYSLAVVDVSERDVVFVLAVGVNLCTSGFRTCLRCAAACCVVCGKSRRHFYSCFASFLYQQHQQPWDEPRKHQTRRVLARDVRRTVNHRCIRRIQSLSVCVCVCVCAYWNDN